MYLVLSPVIAQNTIINYQSVGREITTVSSIRVLEHVKEKSEILVFYDNSLDLQKLLDLYYLLDLNITIIVNKEEDLNIFKGIYNVMLVDYKTIDGKLIRALKSKDNVALIALQRDNKDKYSLAFKENYLDEIQTIYDNITSSSSVKDLVSNYKNLYILHQELLHRLNLIESEHDKSIRQVYSLKQALKKYSLDMKSFVSSFTNLQNKYKSITALSVIRENSVIPLPQHIMTLTLKDYGIPDVFTLLSSLYDALTTFYNKYVKVIYICEPDSISINRLPSNYSIVNNEINQSDLIVSDFIAMVGNVDIPIDFILNSSVLNTLIIVDGRRTQEQLFVGESLSLNLAPDYFTSKQLGLDQEHTITPSYKSKYQLKEEILTQENLYGSRNSKLVNEIISTLLERRGEL